jgi:phytoene dehydrogenase-like protein
MSAISSIDFLIVGAGFSGLVTAERLTNSGFRCVVIDQRDHLGGNAYDCYDETDGRDSTAFPRGHFVGRQGLAIGAWAALAAITIDWLV